MNTIRLQSALFPPTRKTATIDTLPEFMPDSSPHCNKTELAAILFFLTPSSIGILACAPLSGERQRDANSPL